MPLPSILTPRTSARLTDAILSLQPTAYWPLDDGSGPLRDLTGRWPATVTGSPTFGVSAPSPIERGVTWPGGSVYARTSTSVPAPTTGITTFGFVTAPTNAASRTIIARSLQHRIILDAGGLINVAVFQSGGGSHAGINSGSNANDGRWHLAGMTFDGTTLRAFHVNSSGVLSTGSSTTLTGSWSPITGQSLDLSAYAPPANPMIGTTAHVAVIHDRILTAADFRYLASIAFGG